MRPVVELVGDGSRFRGWAPRPALAGAVELIWSAEGIGGHEREKVLPNGVVELIINLGAPQRVVDPTDPRRFVRYHRSWVAGSQRSFILISSEVDCDLVGIRFRPGGAHALLGLPMATLTDLVVEGDDLDRPLRAALGELHERLLAAPSGWPRVQVVQDMLMQTSMPARLDHRVAAAVRAVARAGEATRVATIAADLGLSHKHLIDLFKRHVGLTPKMLGRVLRFQATLRGIAAARAVDWAEIAARFGYSDQAHLIAEFRALAGATPTAYWSARLPDVNHVRV